jgi:hypothetical protein
MGTVWMSKAGEAGMESEVHVHVGRSEEVVDGILGRDRKRVAVYGANRDREDNPIVPLH